MDSAAQNGPTGVRLGTLRSAFWKRVRDLLPYVQSQPFTYTPALLAYVAVVSLGAATLAGIAITTNPPNGHLGTLIAGGLATMLLAAMSVNAVSGVSTVWSASAFLHIGLSLSLGPIGALVASCADSTGRLFRVESSWFRLVFNTADFIITDLCCWAVYTRVMRTGPATGWRVVAASVLVGLACWVANMMPVAGVLRVSIGRDFQITGFLRRSLTGLLYDFGYAYGGYVFVLVRDQGPLGMTSAISSAVLLQGFLVVLERRTKEFRAAEAESARIEKELLQRAVDASEQERQRIAGELHDGVVQDLVGMSMQLSAGSRVTEDMTDRERKMAALLHESAKVTRSATGDLRTLMIEIAPPSLADEGLASVLHDLLAKVERAGITPHLDMADDTGLTEQASKLIYRVAQEAVRNAIKYSKAETLTVRIIRVADAVTLTVHDDGIGFTDEKREQRRHEGHMGLGLLTQTAKDGGGALTIASEPGHGSTVTLVLPLAASATAT